MKSKPNSSLEKIQDIISSIYDAALDSTQWNTITSKLVKDIDAEVGYLRVINQENNSIQKVYSYNKDPYWDQAYQDHYVNVDPWLNNIFTERKTYIACSHHLIPNNTYKTMEYYNEFINPQKIHYGLGTKFHINQSSYCYLALNRDIQKQEFNKKDVNYLQLLVPHLQKALLINDKTDNLELEYNLLSHALNQVSNPLLLVNKKGKILYVNQPAEEIIKKQSAITIRNDHLTFVPQKENKKLLQLIYSAAQESKESSIQQGGSMVYTDPINNIYLSLLISPVNPDKANLDTTSHETALILLNSNDQQQTVSPELLKSLYKLTQAESRLTIELCKGFSLDEIADRFSLSKNTLRTQLRSCFNKVGVSRQSELIRIVSR